MAKFLSYEDRLEIESGLKEHMSFTENGIYLSNSLVELCLKQVGEI